MVLAKGGHGYGQGHPLTSPREWFTSACQLAGLFDLRWYDLRHTFVSRLVMAGVVQGDVQELMGHKTIAMTCRYAHLTPSHQLEAVRKSDTWRKRPRDKGEPIPELAQARHLVVSLVTQELTPGHSEVPEQQPATSRQVLVQ